MLCPHFIGTPGAIILQPLDHLFDIILCRYQFLHWEQLDRYGDSLHRGYNLAIHQNALHHDPLEGFVSGLRRTVNRVLVLPLHLVPGFLVEGGGVRCQERLYLLSRFIRTLLMVYLQDRVDCAAKATYDGFGLAPVPGARRLSC